jgi:hypothetical protein
MPGTIRCAAVALVATAASMLAQSPSPASRSFEAASIKINNSGQLRTDARVLPSGLTGTFDFDLTWTPDQTPQQQPPPGDPPVDPNGPSIFTAIQEQLGLKIESARGAVDVTVVDRAELPTED